MHLYWISGMAVASETPLPGAWPLETGQADVIMRRAKVGLGLERPVASTRRWDASEDQFLLRVPSVGRFLISRGVEVAFEPAAEASDEDCATYLQGTVIAVLLNQRGGVVLHASAVDVAGKAVLFCGPSGEGKSTLAAALCQRGHGLLSDDVAMVRFDGGGRPLVSADARKLKLTQSAVEALRMDGRGPTVGGSCGKTYVCPPSRGGGEERPLAAIYMLETSEAAGDRICALDTAAALDGLSRNAHRRRILKLTNQAGRYFEAATRIIGRAGVFTLRRPRDLGNLPTTAAVLEGHWRSLGLR